MRNKKIEKIELPLRNSNSITLASGLYAMSDAAGYCVLSACSCCCALNSWFKGEDEAPCIVYIGYLESDSRWVGKLDLCEGGEKLPVFIARDGTIELNTSNQE